VAGLEPENTNTFLQMLAAAATVGPARYCSPRHRLPFNSRNEGSTCVG